MDKPCRLLRFMNNKGVDIAFKVFVVGTIYFLYSNNIKLERRIQILEWDIYDPI